MLKAKHLFKMTKIVNKLGELPKIDKGAPANVVGMELIKYLIGNLDKAEYEIYDLAAEYKGINVREMKDMPLNDFVEIIKEIIQEINFKDFLSLAAK